MKDRQRNTLSTDKWDSLSHVVQSCDWQVGSVSRCLMAAGARGSFEECLQYTFEANLDIQKARPLHRFVQWKHRSARLLFFSFFWVKNPLNPDGHLWKQTSYFFPVMITYMSILHCSRTTHPSHSIISVVTQKAKTQHFFYKPRLFSPTAPTQFLLGCLQKLNFSFLEYIATFIYHAFYCIAIAPVRIIQELEGDGNGAGFRVGEEIKGKIKQ